MAPSIGLNLRVTGYKHQGGRKYMEDEFAVAYQQTSDEKDLEYAYFGIFDGHGGRDAAQFAKDHLMDSIVKQKNFWEEDDQSVLNAIREGFIQTHLAMWKELPKWPKTPSGLDSTAGTTASIAFIRRGKIYIGHVGDSAIVLGTQDPNNPDNWRSEPLTRDHKPESLEENKRIVECGGKVVNKSGVPRVVWNRPKMGHKGPVRRSTHIDEIPFLAVARSLGDLWSWNSEEDTYVVSPEPDTHVYPLDINRHRCLVLGTDGAWNMLTPQNSITTVCQAEKKNEEHMLNTPPPQRPTWINPSKTLVDCAIDRWNSSKLRADNTSVVTVMLDPPGPPRAKVLQKRKTELAELNAGRNLHSPVKTPEMGFKAMVTNTYKGQSIDAAADPRPSCSVISRFPNSHVPADVAGHNIYDSPSVGSSPLRPIIDFQGPKATNSLCSGRLFASTVATTARSPSPQPSTSKASPSSTSFSPSLFGPSRGPPQDKVQCNEISSSDERSPSTDLERSPITFTENRGGKDLAEMPSQNSKDNQTPSLTETVPHRSKLSKQKRHSSISSNELRALDQTPVLMCTAKRRSKTPLDSPVVLQKTKKSVASLNVSKSSAKRSLGSPQRQVIIDTPLSRRARMRQRPLIVDTPLSKQARKRSESGSHLENDQPIKKSAKKVTNKPVQIKAKRMKKGESSPRTPRCKVCSGCKRKDCQTCENCLDKRRFGGPGIKKQVCKMRECEKIKGLKKVKLEKIEQNISKNSGKVKHLVKDEETIYKKKKLSSAGSVSRPTRSRGHTPKDPCKLICCNTSSQTVKTPSDTSKTPRVTSKTSSITLRTSSLTPKTSSLASMTPKGSSKTSSVASNTLKGSSKTSSVTSKTPNVSSKTPRSTSKTPNVSSKTPTSTPKTLRSTSKTPNVSSKTPTSTLKTLRSTSLTPNVASKTSSAVKRKRTGVDEELPAQKRPKTQIQSQSPKMMRGRPAKILKLRRRK